MSTRHSIQGILLVKIVYLKSSSALLSQICTPIPDMLELYLQKLEGVFILLNLRKLLSPGFSPDFIITSAKFAGI